MPVVISLKDRTCQNKVSVVQEKSVQHEETLEFFRPKWIYGKWWTNLPLIAFFLVLQVLF